MLLTMLAWSVATAQTPPAPPAPAPKPAPAAPKPPAAPAAPAAPPTVAPCTVLLPTYSIDGANPQAGSMFAVKVGEKQLLVTAYSVFGPAGGLKAQIPADQLATRVTAATAKDSFDSTTVCAKIKRASPLSDAITYGGGHDMTKDLAAFEVDTDPGYAAQTTTPVPLAFLTLATRTPKVGDKVYLLAFVKGQTGRAFPAKVVQSDAGYVFFQFDDGTLDLAGTLGAPVVDPAGALLGVAVAGTKMPDGALIGGATPLAATKARLEAAAK